jgi:hypothetical protein
LLLKGFRSIQAVIERAPTQDLLSQYTCNDKSKNDQYFCSSLIHSRGKYNHWFNNELIMEVTEAEVWCGMLKATLLFTSALPFLCRAVDLLTGWWSHSTIAEKTTNKSHWQSNKAHTYNQKILNLLDRVGEPRALLQGAQEVTVSA